jgi:large subunit ribosomal protein L1
MSGKKFTDALKRFDRDAHFNPTEALTLVKSLASAKFDETIEVAMRLGVDPRKAEQAVRGTVALPSGTGKNIRVAVFATGEAAEEARKAGAKIPVKKQAGGLMGRRAVGMALTDAEAKRAAGRSMSYLSPKGKAALAKAPTRAQYDAMIAAQAAAPVITPAQRRAMNNETMIGRKKGGSVKC